MKNYRFRLHFSFKNWKFEIPKEIFVKRRVCFQICSAKYLLAVFATFYMTWCLYSMEVWLLIYNLLETCRLHRIFLWFIILFADPSLNVIFPHFWMMPRKAWNGIEIFSPIFCGKASREETFLDLGRPLLRLYDHLTHRLCFITLRGVRPQMPEFHFITLGS